MTRKEKQLLNKDLCGRIPYGVKFTLSGNNIYTMKGIDLIVTDEGDWEYVVKAKGITPIEIEYIKPYLRPMSSMSAEEYEIYNGIAGFGTYEQVMEDRLDWLLSRHLDFRGLIPMGLALEAPEDMYNN